MEIQKPTIVDYTNATHDHSSNAQGGILSSYRTRTIVVSSGNFTAGSTQGVDYVYFISGAHTASLPAAALNTCRYTIKNNHSANITIDTVGAETIDGSASISIYPEESVEILSNGTNYFVL